ncbi:hypothetical protein L227DRAFT_514335, partial [Lentinus tigrinus ALCF2SS1-6]
ISGSLRQDMIHSFCKWKGEMFMPEVMHNAIKWSQPDPFSIQNPSGDTPWTLIRDKLNTKNNEAKETKKDTTGFVPARGTQALNNEADDMESEIALQKVNKHIKASLPPKGSKTFLEFPWDPVNWSCAYDSLLTILLLVYTECNLT